MTQLKRNAVGPVQNTFTAGQWPVALTAYRHVGHVPPPPFLQMAAHGGTVSRRTVNKKLTKLYWPSRKRSPKQLIVGYFYSQKSAGARPKMFPNASRRTGAPPPFFQIRSGAMLPAGLLVELSNDSIH